MALPLFALTLFTSAFLLFLVQPMIGKMILPPLGGTPQVWNTCMVFFQTVLLLGYFYTHAVSTRLSLRKQVIVHGVLLFLPLLFLFLPMFTRGATQPFDVVGFDPPPGANPIWATLAFLGIVVGVPFFVVSTSAPLLQKWFSSTGHPSAHDPYFLYGASNLGSLLSLLLYPVLIEPLMRIPIQTWVWAVGYLVLIGLILASMVVATKAASMLQLAGVNPEEPPPPEYPVPPVEEPSTAIKAPEPRSAASSTSIRAGSAPAGPRGISRKKGPKHAIKAAPSIAEPPPLDTTRPREDAVTWGRRLRWVLLSAIPSSLMLGVINYISTDLSPFPLVWVFPLALYLLTFILVFSKWPMPWLGLPHTVILFIQPVALLALIWILLSGSHEPIRTTFVCWLGFFITTLMCHGELARDRPTPKYLTEYFLALSVGGMLGGLFNGIIAPIVFHGVLEYPLAIIAAALLRPRQRESGWIDEAMLGNTGVRAWVEETGDELSRAMGKPATHSPYVLNYLLDIALGVFVFLLTYALSAFFSPPRLQGEADRVVSVMRFLGVTNLNYYYSDFHRALVYGLPCMICLFYGWTRPLRFCIGIASVLLVGLYIAEGRSGVIYSDRTYFGVIRIIEHGLDKSEEYPYTDGRDLSLLHGTTDFGHNYQSDNTDKFAANSLRRLATMYYHRYGPLGFAMERYNWFPGKQMTYNADARMPVSLIGLGAASFGVGNLPLEQIMDAQCSEPPYAVIGLGTGTMASYARAYEHLAYYEIDNLIKSFSLPTGDRDPYFYYLKDAIDRGSNVEVIMGDARQSMSKERMEVTYLNSPTEPSHYNPSRDHYYKVIVVDAFSSDAIPIHLITYEAVKMYFDKLAPDGVLCVHTSNRHLDLVLPVMDIAKELVRSKAEKSVEYRVAHSDGGRTAGPLGFTSSEYVLLARDMKYLESREMPNGTHWPPLVPDNRLLTFSHPPAQGNRLWTDDFSNIVGVLNILSPRRQ